MNGRCDKYISRRGILFLAGAAGMAVASPLETPKICIFSKHLQWLSMPEAAKLAAEIGFDGIDITVREGGHVEPARVAEDLPKAVEAVRHAGLEVPMITAGIADTHSPHAAEILRAASSLGIRRYRWGELRLDLSRSIPEQIEAYRPAVRDLETLNHRFGVCAMYHTHSGKGLLGASIWDLYLLLKGFDPHAVGVNYDVAHATIEGGLGGWRETEHLIAPSMRGVALKDFYWAKNARGVWAPRWCPIGEGMVHFVEFFQFLSSSHFSGPVQLHFEYPEMGGANEGKRAITLSRAQFAKKAGDDLSRIRQYMRKAGFTRQG